MKLELIRQIFKIEIWTLKGEIQRTKKGDEIMLSGNCTSLICFITVQHKNYFISNFCRDYTTSWSGEESKYLSYSFLVSYVSSWYLEVKLFVAGFCLVPKYHSTVSRTSLFVKYILLSTLWAGIFKDQDPVSGSWGLSSHML